MGSGIVAEAGTIVMDSAQLSAVPLLRSLSDELVNDFVQSAQMCTARRKHVIVGTEQQFPYLGILLQGMLYVTAPIRGSDGSGRLCALFGVQPGQTFAEFAMFDGRDIIGEVSCLVDSHYALIPRDVVNRWMRRDFALTERLVRRATYHARQAVQRLAGHMGYPIITRVAAALLPYATDGEGLQPSDPTLHKITHIQLAALAGSVKEVVARAIAELEQAGALKRQRGHIAYLDRQKLIEFAVDAAPIFER